MKVDEQKVKELLLSKKLLRCPLCHSEEHWSIDDEIFPIIKPDLKGKTLSLNVESPEFAPFIVLTCENCGNTHFLNAKVLGLL